MSTDPEPWYESEDWRRGIELLDAGRFFECHEVLETLWRRLGRRSPAGRSVQALIWIAVAELKAEAGEPAVARRFARRAAERLAESDGVPPGLDAGALRRRLEALSAA